MTVIAPLAGRIHNRTSIKEFEIGCFAPPLIVISQAIQFPNPHCKTRRGYLARMTEAKYDMENGEVITVPLRDPRWAALLAWLWPGAGHIYQRRYAKGMLFMICILSTFCFGLLMGRGRVVYASSRPNDFRWHYFCQLGVGLPALPALPQAYATQDGGPPWFQLCRRYPAGTFTADGLREFAIIPPGDTNFSGKPLIDGFMAPPAGPVTPERNDVLGMWHSELGHWFEMGTLYTMVAGLLNLLAVYDAFAGPMIITPEMRRKLEEKNKKQPESVES